MFKNEIFNSLPDSPESEEHVNLLHFFSPSKLQPRTFRKNNGRTMGLRLVLSSLSSLEDLDLKWLSLKTFFFFYWPLLQPDESMHCFGYIVGQHVSILGDLCSNVML